MELRTADKCENSVLLSFLLFGLMESTVTVRYIAECISLHFPNMENIFAEIKHEVGHEGCDL